MHRLVSGVMLMLLLMVAGSVSAHHSGPTVSPQASGNYHPYLLGSGGPKKSLTYTFNWSHLDNGAGDVFLNQIEGEYAIFDWFSVLLRIPILSLQLNFRPDKTGIGDVAIGMKGRVLHSNGHSLMLGSDFTFPTGNRNAGTGSGEVAMSPYVAYQYDFGLVQVFSSLGTAFQFNSNPEPALAGTIGLSVPVLQEPVGVTLFTSLQTQTFLADETFTRGSSKVYVVPGLMIKPIQGYELSFVLSGTLSIIDTLAVKSSLVLRNDSLALTQDILMGATLQVNYSF